MYLLMAVEVEQNPAFQSVATTINSPMDMVVPSGFFGDGFFADGTDTQCATTTKNQKLNGTQPLLDPEVTVKAKRRTFSAQYKRRILEKADRCIEPNFIGALLRREGLHSSNLTTPTGNGGLAGLQAKKLGSQKDEQATEMARLQGENARLHQQPTEHITESHVSPSGQAEIAATPVLAERSVGPHLRVTVPLFFPASIPGWVGSHSPPRRANGQGSPLPAQS